RRVKTDAELAGIRRAQRAAEAGMDAARNLFRRATSANGGLEVDGEQWTAERVKSAMFAAFVAHGASSDDIIVAPGAQGAVGHDMGSGPIAAGVPIVIDIWPRDNESFMYCDMTRTFVVGDVPEDVARWHALAKEALDRAISEIRDGVGLEVHEEPGMGLAAELPLRAGDVVTVEPGCYRQGYGGVRLEDLVLVTEQGAENLTRYPYDLQA